MLRNFFTTKHTVFVAVVLFAVALFGVNAVLLGEYPPPAQAQTAATITLNSSQRFQTIVGWEATAGSDILRDFPNTFQNWLPEAIDRAVNELGINRIRLESHQEFDAVEVTNDNSDPFSINWSGFDFTEFDKTVDHTIIPMRNALAARGESLYINFNTVSVGSSDTFPTPDHFHKDPEEFAEFVLAHFIHMRDKYGFVPDGMEVSLEPDVFNTFDRSGTKLGQALVATGDRLKANGFTPDFIAPSNSGTPSAVQYFDQLIQVPRVKEYLTEFAYHRYSALTPVSQIASRAAIHSIGTAMLEHIGADYNELHEDLKVGNNSAWQQFVLAYPTSDNGAQYFTVSNPNGPSPTVTTASRTKFLRQYFYYVRAGAERIAASTTNSSFDPIAFINSNGRYAVVTKASTGGSFAINNLPAGTYGVNYTTNSQYNISLADQTISQGQTLTATIPASGVITVYGKSGGGTTPPPPPPPPSSPKPVSDPNGSWSLIFQDEFNGSSLDTSKWDPNWFNEGGVMNNVGTYASNVSVSGGNVILQLESANRGALINTQSNNGFTVMPGMYAEARIYFPGSSGTNLYNWSAWWLSGPNWPSAGEHDIAEILGGRMTVNYHSPSGAHNQGQIPGSWGNAFHVYGIYRGTNSAQVYYDGNLVKSYPTDDNGGGENLILNVGSGSSPDAYGSAGAMRVDYVRVWEPGSGGSPPPPPPPPSPPPIPGNLISNSTCDTNTAGWSAWQGTLSRNASIARSGAASCQVARTSGDYYTLDDSPNTVPSLQQGQEYTASAWVRSSTAVGKPVKLVMRQFGGATATGYAESQAINLSTNWQQVTLTVTIEQPDRTSLDVYVIQEDAVSGNSFQADDISLVLSGSSTPPPPPSGMEEVAWWKLDEGSGTSAADSSGNNRTGTLVNGPAWTTGKFGQALQFDGSNDYVRTVDFDFASGPFTLSAWFKTASSAAQMLLFKGSASANQIYFLFDPGEGVFCGLHDGADWQEVADSRQAWNNNQWHHASCVVDTNTVRVYVDGTTNGRTDSHDNSFPTNNNPWELGRRTYVNDLHLAGALDDIRIHNKALSAAEISQLMQSPSPSPSPPPPTPIPPPPPPPPSISTLDRLHIFLDNLQSITITGTNFTTTDDFRFRMKNDTGTVRVDVQLRPTSSTTIVVDLAALGVNTGALDPGYYTIELERVSDGEKTTAQSQFLVTKLGDIPDNTGARDGKIDIGDVNRLFSKFGSANAGDLTEADVSGPNGASDNKIDIYDANKLMANWTG